MARRERGLIRMILSDFLSSFKTGGEKVLIGEDFHGTKYFETVPRSATPGRPVRHFEPVNKNDFTQDIPAEWEAWLRYRRRDAPEKEEVERNYKLMIEKRENAAILSETYSETKIKKLTSSENAETPGGFPVYEEYKQYGVQYKVKK